MKTIQLTRGKVAVVDDSDYERLAVHKWYASCEGKWLWYAQRAVGSRGRQKSIRMHREILGAPTEVQVHHRDGDGLNNTRENLQLVTPQQNSHGFQHKRKGCSSRFRGVCLHKQSKKWLARICVSGVRKQLGLFKAEEAAARAYDQAAKELFGAFAVPNPI